MEKIQQIWMQLNDYVHLMIKTGKGVKIRDKGKYKTKTRSKNNQSRKKSHQSLWKAQAR